MARHRRRRTGPFVRRSVYLSLWRRYNDLLEAYRALEGDHQAVLEDHEGLLHDLEDPAPLERSGARHTPSWAETEEIPVITSLVPLDPDKAEALLHRSGMTAAPSGAWGGQKPGTTG